jgi:RNA polymerase sigma factor (sigma-70 family)
VVERSIVRPCKVNDGRHFEEFEHCAALDLICASAFSIVAMNATASRLDRRSFDVSRHLRLVASPSAELMITYLAPMLGRVARRYESDAPSCADLQQEMLIAIWLSLDSYERKSSFGTWVHTIAHRVGAQHLVKRRISRRTEQLDNDFESLPSSHDTESLVATHERALLLLGLLNGLRPLERAAVLLDLQEFELHEMSQAMAISQARARDTLVRAKRRLMIWMKRSDDAPSGIAPEYDCEDDLEADPRAVYYIERPRKWSANGRT